MLIYILVALALIVIVLGISVALRPSEFCVTRTTTISAPAALVFEQVNDFHKWEAWSPWAKLDPAAKTTFDGPPAGTGASYSWAGNKKIGAGQMTILENRPSELVRIKLEFLRPFKATNTAEFTFKAENNQTIVTWKMFGKNNFIAKAVHMVVDCDKMIGADFEKGLAQMKAVAEAKNGK